MASLGAGFDAHRVSTQVSTVSEARKMRNDTIIEIIVSAVSVPQEVLLLDTAEAAHQACSEFSRQFSTLRDIASIHSELIELKSPVWAASDVAPYTIRQIMSCKEDHPIYCTSLLVSN